MKLTLKTLIAAIALGVTALPMLSSAQDPTTPATPPAGGQGGGKGGKGGGRAQMTPEARVTAIEEAVGKLSPDLKTKITAIVTKQNADVQALDQADRRTKGGEIRTAANKEIRALLTAEQATKFDAMPQGGRGGGGGGGKKGGGN
jgi:protein CpxP